MDKKASLIVNIILAVAVVALFILHFMSGGSSTDAGEGTSGQKPAKRPDSLRYTGELSIAYVNTDTVLANYYFYIDQKAEMEKKIKARQSELERRQQTLQQNAQAYQRKAQSGGFLLESTRMEAEQKLMAEQQQLMQLNEQYTLEIQELEKDFQMRLSDSLVNYVKLYNETNGYTLILSSAYGGAVLDAAPALNITDDILEGLNKRYKEAVKDMGLAE